jgi:hypothetical protein
MVTRLLQFPSPAMRRGAGLHGNDTAGMLGEKHQHLAA